MRLALAMGFLLLATTVQAQDLPRRPEPGKTNDLTSALQPISLMQSELLASSPIPKGMVWAIRDKAWIPMEINSCEWCGKPMTFKEAAFDKKMTSIWLLETALTVADIEIGQACLRASRCKEGNPFLGTGSRAQEYGIRLPSIAMGWLSATMLRKGDKGRHIGGMKHWYVIPMVQQAMSTVGVVSGMIH